MWCNSRNGSFKNVSYVHIMLALFQKITYLHSCVYKLSKISIFDNISCSVVENEMKTPMQCLSSTKRLIIILAPLWESYYIRETRRQQTVLFIWTGLTPNWRRYKFFLFLFVLKSSHLSFATGQVSHHFLFHFIFYRLLGTGNIHFLCFFCFLLLGFSKKKCFVFSQWKSQLLSCQVFLHYWWFLQNLEKGFIRTNRYAHECKMSSS